MFIVQGKWTNGEQRGPKSQGVAGEPASLWRKSTRSWGNGNCAEIAQLGHLVGVRDSKNPRGHVLRFTASEWRMFLDGVREERSV